MVNKNRSEPVPPVLQRLLPGPIQCLSGATLGISFSPGSRARLVELPSLLSPVNSHASWLGCVAGIGDGGSLRRIGNRRGRLFASAGEPQPQRRHGPESRSIHSKSLTSERARKKEQVASAVLDKARKGCCSTSFGISEFLVPATTTGPVLPGTDSGPRKAAWSSLTSYGNLKEREREREREIPRGFPGLNLGEPRTASLPDRGHLPHLAKKNHCGARTPRDDAPLSRPCLLG